MKANMLTLFKLIQALVIVFGLVIPGAAAAALTVDDGERQGRAFGRCGQPEQIRIVASEMKLPQIVREVEQIHFGERKLNNQSLDEFVNSLCVNEKFKKPGGVFVTLSRNGKTRACWGTVFPQEGSIARATAYATIGALTKEYRFPPVKASEWKKLKIQVTVIKGIEPIASIHMQNPLRDGLFVRAGGRAGVELPGEASDAYYQMVLAKLKAGIRPKEPCQLYRLRTEIYE